MTLGEEGGTVGLEHIVPRWRSADRLVCVAGESREEGGGCADHVGEMSGCKGGGDGLGRDGPFAAVYGGKRGAR